MLIYANKASRYWGDNFCGRVALKLVVTKLVCVGNYGDLLRRRKVIARSDRYTP